MGRRANFQPLFPSCVSLPDNVNGQGHRSKPLTCGQGRHVEKMGIFKASDGMAYEALCISLL